MEQQTVTDDALFEASDVEPVANDSTTEQADDGGSSAVEATNEQTDSQKSTIDEPAASTDAQTGDAVDVIDEKAIDDLLAKKGIDQSDPNSVRKVAAMYLNSEKGFLNKSQQAAQLQRKLAEAQTLDVRPDQQALNEVRSMRIEMDTKEWKASHNLTPEDEQKMVEYVSTPLTDRRGKVVTDPVTGTPFTRGMLVNNGVLSLDDVYRLAGCGIQKADNLKDAYRDEVRKEMAARQAAKRPSSNATDSTQFGKAEENDPFITGLLGN